MSNYLLVIAMIAAQMGVFTLAWLLVGRLRLAPRLATAAIVCNASLGVAMALISARSSLPDWVGFALANALVVLSLLMMRRGIRAFAYARTWRHQDAFILAVCVLGLAVSLDEPTGSLRIVMSHVPMTLLLLHTGWGARHDLEGEFGGRIARLFAAPIVLIGVLQGLRTLGAFAWPGVFAPRIEQPSAANMTFTAVIMVGALFINMSMLTMVILRVVRRLDLMTRQDPMTGLLNRRAIEHALGHEVEVARRQAGGSMSLLAIDVDHFKRINDDHGHPVGDAALVALAQTLRETARTGDLVARVGGEEFWALLPNTDATGALALAERIRGDVAARTHDAAGQALRITVSVGVAVLVDRAETPQQLSARADKALYEAKAGGRNCCRLAGAPQPEIAPRALADTVLVKNF